MVDRINVKVTIKDGRIVNIDVDHNETEGIGAAAIPHYVEQTIAKNGLDIDSVTGATVSLNGYKDAVSRALAKALE